MSALNDNILTKIDVIVSQAGFGAKYAGPDADLRNDVGMDSLDILDLIQRSEEAFSVRELERCVDQIRTGRDLAGVIEARLGHKN